MFKGIKLIKCCDHTSGLPSLIMGALCPLAVLRVNGFIFHLTMFPAFHPVSAVIGSSTPMATSYRDLLVDGNSSVDTVT